MADEISVDSSLTHAALKSKFKQLQIQTNDVFQNWQIRVHRSLSWRQRAAAMPDDQPEGKFIYLWIALNCLYSKWDNHLNIPDGDTASRNVFLERTCHWDGDAIGQRLRKSRGLLAKIIENPFLSTTFWREPDHPDARVNAIADARHIEDNFARKNYATLLKQLLGRLFVFRGQIVHGSSTGGGKLNRTTLRHCLMALEIFVPVIQKITIDHGANDDWPDLCYPPVK